MNSAVDMAETAQEAPLKEFLPLNMRSELFKMLFSLVILLGAFGVCIWAFKKLLRNKTSRLGSSSAIKILDKRALTPKSSIYLVEVANKVLILSESNDSISLLSEFPPNTDILELMKSRKDSQPQLSPKDFILKAIQTKKPPQESPRNTPIP
ncbi:flagellar biosynthetic protein FliO [Chlamydiifrater volucris]|uniref:flagellar biosynthetic protein FliO n=1 Tax=Chlamydiifrater volucris TaxID=2681470 RepID=UPI001BCA7306|nr:flagellar biosynthetic protein FliO [Chlamydiifrater volucris]